MRPIFLLLVSALLWQPFAFAQDAPQPAEAQQSFFDYLHAQGATMPVITLETDWNLLIRKKMNKEYQPGKLGFVNADGQNTGLEIEIKARGNMRKQVCHFPPLRLKLSKKQLKALGFSPYNDIKLVLQCRSGSREEEWLLKEWFIYQLYECISPAALRTKLVKVQGIHDGKEKNNLSAFLLEYEDEMAARLGAKVVKQGVMRVSGLERDSYVKTCFFQYMIANTDWSVPNRHNLEFIMAPQYPGIVPIAYDFDYAGLIQTSYAVPYEELPIKSVTDRYFMGHNVTAEEAMEARRHFLAKKGEIMQLCQNFNLLEERARRPMIKFISDFFDLLEDEKRMKRIFVTN